MTHNLATEGTRLSDSSSADSDVRGTDLHHLLGKARDTKILVPFILLFISLCFLTPSFFDVTNILNVLDQQAMILIVAAAGTFVLIAGGIDLSVGAIYALSALIAVQLSNSMDPYLAMLISVAAGLVIGIGNGLLVTVVRLPPMIATLAMSFIVAGLATIVAGGTVLIALRPAFRTLGSIRYGPLALTTIVAALVVMLCWVVLSATSFGRSVFAVGGNEEAARLSGIRTSRIKITTYAMSGSAAALAGVMIASRVGSGQADFGNQVSLMFTVLVGVVVGGTSLAGGEGSIWRTCVGVLFIALIHNGFVLMRLDSVYEQIILGLLIIIAVGVDSWRRNQNH